VEDGVCLFSGRLAERNDALMERLDRMQPMETLDSRAPILHLHLPRLARRDVRVCPPDAACPPAEPCPR
jgi:hypothetical protein